MLLTRALIAVIVALVLVSPAVARDWVDEESWWIKYVGGDMNVESDMHRDLDVNDDVVTKNFDAHATGNGVHNVELHTSSQYREEIDGLISQASSEIYQQITLPVLPGNLQVTMDNNHELVYSYLSTDKNLGTSMDVFSSDGKSLMSLKTCMDSDIEAVIDNALENVAQTWHQTYGDGGKVSGGEFDGGIDYDEGDIVVTIGYKTADTIPKDGVICNYGHSIKTTRTIEVY
jgi:hypothetical protein